MGSVSWLLPFQWFEPDKSMGAYSESKKIPQSDLKPSQRCRLSFIRYIPDPFHARSKLAELNPNYPPWKSGRRVNSITEVSKTTGTAEAARRNDLPSIDTKDH